MDKYLFFMEKVLNLKEDIESKILDGKVKGYIFKTYKNESGEFENVDGLVIETKIIDDVFMIWVTTYHLEGEEIVQNSNCGCINITSETCDIGGVAHCFDNKDIKNIYLCSTSKLIKDGIIDLDFIENAIIIKAFVKDYKQNYKQYLETEHWKSIRESKLKETGYKCQLCSKTDIKLHVHHNTYERIGDEDMNDLIVLCESCHKKFHNID